jgi:hypothetical protein
MNKQETKAAIMFVIALIFGYLVGAFGAADFNISNWNPFFRIAVALIAPVFAVLCGVITLEKSS